MKEVKNFDIKNKTFQMKDDVEITSYVNQKITSINDDSFTMAFEVENPEWEKAFDRKETACIYVPATIASELESEGISQYFWIEGRKNIVKNDVSKLITLLSLTNKDNLVELSSSLNDKQFFKVIVSDLILAYSKRTTGHYFDKIVEGIDEKIVNFSQKEINPEWDYRFDKYIDTGVLNPYEATKVLEADGVFEYRLYDKQETLGEYGVDNLLKDIYMLEPYSIKGLLGKIKNAPIMKKNVASIYKLKQKIVEMTK